jgi:hypothetical protein
MKIINKHFKDFALPNGQVVPANSAINVSDSQWESMQFSDLVRSWMSAGYLEAEAPDAEGNDPDQEQRQRKPVSQPRQTRSSRAKAG